MKVLGRDSAREAYRVRSDGITGFIPDHVISRQMKLTGGRGHQTAYDWISKNASEIDDALHALSANETPRAPFHLIDLEED